MTGDLNDSQIEVLEVIEHEDGSATIKMEMGKEAVRLLLKKAFITILEESILLTAQDSKKCDTK